MAFPQVYCVEWLSGRAVKRRGLAWFIPRPEIASIDGKSEFEKLDDGARQNLSNRFDAWIDGDKPRKEYYHGWDEQGFENAWVFKYREHRLFGFLCHPDDEDKRFQMCVICSYTVKTGWEADQTLKTLMQDLSTDQTVLKATDDVHTEEECTHTPKEKKYYEAPKGTKALD